MRVQDLAAKQDLILRSPPKAGISKDGPRRDPPRSFFRLRGERAATVSARPELLLVSSHERGGSSHHLRYRGVAYGGRCGLLAIAAGPALSAAILRAALHRSPRIRRGPRGLSVRLAKP